MNYLLHLLIYLDIYVIVALSLNMIVGYGGLLTIAHAGYYAVGGYVYALLALKLGWGFLPAVLVGVVIAALLSLALSLPSWRFGGDFFVMISLAVQVLLFSIFRNWSSPNAEPGTWTNLTNGPFGLSGIPKPAILTITLDSTAHMAVLATVLATGCALVSFLLLDSPWGRLLKAMRDDELAARGLGKNVRLAKVQVFAVACGMVAVAGAIYASYVSFIDPSAASLDESILMLSFVLVGGVGNFRGPIVGAFVLLAIPELLRFVEMPSAVAANVRLLVYGLLLVGMMHVRPQGIAGEYRVE
jgi:branched-chain amino acid transport system permease protein